MGTIYLLIPCIFTSHVTANPFLIQSHYKKAGCEENKTRTTVQSFVTFIGFFFSSCTNPASYLIYSIAFSLFKIPLENKLINTFVKIWQAAKMLLKDKKTNSLIRNK